MKRTCWIAAAATLFILPATAAVAAPPADPGGGTNRIVGGKELTTLDENPGATGLHVQTDAPGNGGFICGSTRIGPTWVLTAKHCIIDKYTYTGVSTSTIKRSEGPRAKIVKIIKHPKKIDLALVQIEEAPGKITTFTDQGPAMGSVVRNYGWGRINANDPSPVLKVAEGTVARYSQSPVKDPIDLTEGVDLIFKPTDGLCWLGDSGGPLLDATGRLVGVTSWSNGNGTMNGICAHLSLAHMGTAKWITDTTGIAPGTTFPPAG